MNNAVWSGVKSAYHSLPISLRAPIAATGLRLTREKGDVRKQEIVLSYLRRHRIQCFIETGSFEGYMIEAVRSSVARVYSVELDDFLFKLCRWRFVFDRKVTVLNGDSATVLAELLPEIRERALFWLDAHYSGGITAKGDKETPILTELQAIKRHFIKDHVILIDDARCFGEGDYPPISSLSDMIMSINREYRIELAEDIYRAVVGLK